MARYESEIKMMACPVETVYNRFANLENIRPFLDNAASNPAIAEKMREAGQDPAMLERLKDVELTNDSIAMPVPMIGQFSVSIIEREENKCIKFHTDQSPVDATMWIQVLPVAAGGSKLKLTLDAELNMMMKMMIGSKLEKGVNEFANMLAMIGNANIPNT